MSSGNKTLFFCYRFKKNINFSLLSAILREGGSSYLPHVNVCKKKIIMWHLCPIPHSDNSIS